jgi:hypothetical protein
MKNLLRNLDPCEYAEWDALVRASSQGSVSCYSWWIRATGPGARVLGFFENGRLVGGVPLYRSRLFGVPIYKRPSLTYPWGPVLEPLVGKHTTIVTRENAILKSLAAHLAEQSQSMVLSFHPTLQNWLPFQWLGFSHTVGVTHVLDLRSDLDGVFKAFGENARRSVKRAQGAGITIEPCTAEAAFELFACTQKRRGAAVSYSREYLRNLHAAALAQDAGQCFVARDLQRRALVAAFVAWDEKSAYYVAGGSDPKLRGSGAGTLLIWYLIQFCAERARAFDFAGSHIESIEEFFRKFSATKVFYPRVMKLSLPIRLALAIFQNTMN